jgi:hypothetical protein
MHTAADKEKQNILSIIYSTKLSSPPNQTNSKLLNLAKNKAICGFKWTSNPNTLKAALNT